MPNEIFRKTHHPFTYKTRFILENIAVRQHTMDELLAAVGETGGNSNFNVFFIRKGGQPIPLSYPFRTPHFTIFLVTEGRAHVQVNLLNYVLHANEVLLIAPNEVRQFKTLSFDCSVVAIGFTREFLLQANIHQNHADAIELLALQHEPLIQLQPEITAILNHLLQALSGKQREAVPGLYQPEIILHGFAAFILQVAEAFRTSHPIEVKQTRGEDLLMRFLKLLPQHFREERSVQYYAEQLFITPKHLTQTVKDITGRPAGAFIDDMVITEAKILLNNPALSIGQVAEELHFSDQFFFSKYFKKYAGASPSQYRSGE